VWRASCGDNSARHEDKPERLAKEVKRKENMATNCLECAAEINVPNDAIDGEIVTCAECGSVFELEMDSSSAPSVIVLKAAEAVGEDWGE
jgi:alpha-aminoadipate carrier protein LysW